MEAKVDSNTGAMGIVLEDKGEYKGRWPDTQDMNIFRFSGVLLSFDMSYFEEHDCRYLPIVVRVGLDTGHALILTVLVREGRAFASAFACGDKIWGVAHLRNWDRLGVAAVADRVERFKPLAERLPSRRRHVGERENGQGDALPW